MANDDDAPEVLPCPLCGAHDTANRELAHDRQFARCGRCRLTFVRPEYRLSREAERQRYLLHDNSRDHAGYVAFLNDVVEVVRALTPQGATGIDYGCGPVPVLSELLSAAGRPTSFYDPIYHPVSLPPGETYDFVTCCEVAEHAFSPRRLFSTLADLLKPGGVLVLRTRIREEGQPLASWWYARDPTHVALYSAATLDWLAGSMNWAMHRHAADLYVFSRLNG